MEVSSSDTKEIGQESVIQMGQNFLSVCLYKGKIYMLHEWLF